MNTEILLIRHGETEWNRIWRFQGHADVPLSETGREQARRLAAHLAEETLHAVYSSDLIRARQTAEEIAGVHGLKVKTVKELRERDIGEWEGKTADEMAERFPDWIEVRLTGGKYGVEPTEAVKRRMLAVLEELAHKHLGERIAVVSHGMSLGAFLSVIGEGVYRFGEDKLDNTSITRVRFCEKEGWNVQCVNETPHLADKKEEVRERS
jgi:broad specificity phosphatase PhoE